MAAALCKRGKFNHRKRNGHVMVASRWLWVVGCGAVLVGVASQRCKSFCDGDVNLNKEAPINYHINMKQ